MGMEILSGLGWEKNREGAPPAGDAFDLDPSTVSFRDRPGDAEAQARPSFPARAGLGRPVEPLEDARLIFRGNPDPCIFNPDRSPSSAGLQGDGHLSAGRSVLDPVVREVEEEPPQVRGIPLY
jgi:hypothetical protein